MTSLVLNYWTLVMNSLDPDQNPEKNVTSGLLLHWLPLIQQFLDSSKGSKIDMFNYMDKYGKAFRCQIIFGINYLKDFFFYFTCDS